MDTLSTVLRYEMIFVLTALAVIIAYRLLTQQINTKDLLRDKIGGQVTSQYPSKLLVAKFVLLVQPFYRSFLLRFTFFSGHLQ